MKKLFLMGLICPFCLCALGQSTSQTSSPNSGRDSVTRTKSGRNLLQTEKSGNDDTWKPYPVGTTSTYKATVLNTNFTVPLVRFNRVSGDNTKKGSISFFNSIGAGFGINWGRLEITTDNSPIPNVINSEMNNTFGLQIGCLFAANTNNGDQQNIFAPTLSMSVLNFQLGYGYELGTVPENQKRGFITIAYSIPLAKFIKGGFYILKRTPEPIDGSAKRFTGN